MKIALGPGKKFLSGRRSRLVVIGLAGVVVVAGGLFLRNCGIHPARLEPERAIREERLAALEQLAARAAEGPILKGTEALIAVDGRLLQELLNAAMPIEAVISGKYAVRLDSARVTLEDGLALVRLAGRASLAGEADDGSFADAVVYGALDQLEFDPDEALLRGKIRVIAFDAGRVKLFGAEDPSVRRTVLGLGRLRLGAFEELRYTLEIPVQLGRSITLPEVGPEGGVHIPEARIPLALEVTAVRAFHQRLWVSARLAASAAALADSSTARPGRRPAKFLPAMMRRLGGLSPSKSPGSGAVAALRDSLAARLAGDPVVCAVQEDGAPILVILPEALLEDLVRNVAAAYLDRVEIDVGPEEAHESGVIRVSTPLGQVVAGEWTVAVSVHHVTGVLRHGPPTVTLAGESRLAVDIPTRIEGGRGSATIDFNWDPSTLGSVVCRAFRVQRTINGVVTPQEHRIRGSLRIAAGERSLTAYPDFIEEKVPIRLDMTPASWDTIRAALEEQDKLFKCGTVMDPDDLLERLRRIGSAGIRIRLPKVVFRAFELPASLTKSVRIAGRLVGLEVRPEGVRTSGGALWYGALVRIEGALPEVMPPAPAVSPAPEAAAAAPDSS